MNDELPSGWAWSSLDVLVDNFDGQRVPLKATDRAQRQGQFPYYGASGIIDYVDDYLFEGNYLLISEDGANLLARATPIAFQASGRFWANNHAHVLLLKEDMPPGYLENFINSKDLSQLVTGTAQPKLTQRAMNAIAVPVAPLNEQRRIVAKLDALLARIRLAREDLERIPPLIERFRQAVLRTAFSDTAKVSTMNSIAELITKGSSPGWQGFDYQADGLLFLRSQNIGWGALDLESIVFIAPSFNDSHPRSVVRTGDVLLNIVGASIGRVAVAGTEVHGSNLNQAIAIIRPRQDTIISEYLMYFLMSPSTQEYIHGNKSDVARANFNLDDIQGIKVPLKSLREQSATIAKVQSLFSRSDALSAEVKAARERLDVLEQAVLAKAFRGELVPQDPNDEPASVLLERIRRERAEGESEGSSKRGRGRPRKAADVRG